MELTSYDEAAEYFNDLMRQVNVGTPFITLFRGLGKSWYDLKSNVSRGISDANALREKEKNILSSFECYTDCLHRKGIMVKKDLGNAFLNQWHILAQMQHLEVATRLMDWTMRWDMALLFAVSNSKDDTEDGIVYTIKMPRERFYGHQLTGDFDPFNLTDPIMINLWIVADDHESYMKRIAERRRAIQQGRFFVQPYQDSVIPMETNPRYNGLLIRDIIPSAAKQTIRQQLANVGLTEDLVMIEKNKHVEKVKARVTKCSPGMNKFLSAVHF